MAQFAPSEMRTRRSPLAAAEPAGGGYSGSSNGYGASSASAYGASSSASNGYMAGPTGQTSAHGSGGGSYNSYSGGGNYNSYSTNDAWERRAASRWDGNGAQHVASSTEDKKHQPAAMTTQLKISFALLLVTTACLHADQNLAAPNLSAIAADFEMTPMQKDSRLGGMVQFGFFLIGGAVSLLIGPAADQVDRVSLLSAVVLCGSVPSLLMSLWVPSSKVGFFYFLLARVCTGIAIGGSFPVLYSLTADIFPASQRGFVASCVGGSTNVGAALGAMMSGVLGPSLGWRAPFTIVSVPSIICAVVVRLFVTDPRTEQKKEAAAKSASSAANAGFSAWMGTESPPPGCASMSELDVTKFRTVLRIPSNCLVLAQSLPGCIPMSIIATFLSDFLSTEQGMGVQASTTITAFFGISCLCCAMTGGAVGQRLFTTRQDQLALMMTCAACIASVPFILLVNSPKSMVTSASGSPTFFALFLAVIGGVGAVTGPNVRWILMNVNSSEVRGTAFSAFTLCDDLGKGLGPSVVALLTFIFGRRIAYTLGFMLWWVSGAILLGLKGTLPRDVSRGDSLLPMNMSSRKGV